MLVVNVVRLISKSLQFGENGIEFLVQRPHEGFLFAAWIPCAIGLWLSNDPWVSLAWVFVFTFADGIGFAQYANVMQEMFPPQMRARSISAWTVCSSALTYGTGPLMFGLATDFLFPGPSGLRYALGLISLPVMALGLLLSWLGRKPYDRMRLSLDPAAKVDRTWLEDLA